MSIYCTFDIFNSTPTCSLSFYLLSCNSLPHASIVTVVIFSVFYFFGVLTLTILLLCCVCVCVCEIANLMGQYFGLFPSTSIYRKNRKKIGKKEKPFYCHQKKNKKRKIVDEKSFGHLQTFAWAFCSPTVMIFNLYLYLCFSAI